MADTFTLSGNVATLPGVPFVVSTSTSQVDVFVVASEPTITDTETNVTRLGTFKTVVDVDGSFTAAGLPSTADTAYMPSGFSYRIAVRYRDAVTGSERRYESNWFALTADTNFADVVNVELTSIDQATYESLIGARDQAVAAKVAAQAAAAAATQLATSDGQTAANVTGGTLTKTALAASLAAKWKSTTAYTVGQIVEAPDGGTVKVITAHTSTGTYDATKFAVADGVAASIVTGTASKVDNQGFTDNNLRRLRAGIARVRAGTGDGKLLFVGDSLKWGVGGGGPLASMPTKLSTELNKRLTSRPGLYVPPSYLPGANAPDTRWVAGSGWSQNANGFGLGAAWYGAPGAAGSLTFTPGDGVDVDRFDVYFLRHSSDVNATVTIQATGGSAVTSVLGGAAGVIKVTVSLPTSTAATVTLTAPVSQPAFCVGIEGYSSTRRTLRIGNAGIPSSTTAGWVTSVGGFGPVECIKAYAADCTWIALGVNDAFIATPTPLATYKANIQTLITAAKVSGDVVLQTCIPSQSPASIPIQTAYNAALAELAATNGCALVDPAARIGSYAIGQPLGFYNDTVHLNSVGYSDEVGGYLKLFDLVA